MRTKKGVSSHVEIMISFVIFIGLVIFLFIMLNPLEIFSASKSMLDTTAKKVIENITTELTTSSVKIKENYPPPAGRGGTSINCFIIAFQSKTGKNLIVKKKVTNDYPEIGSRIIDENQIKFNYNPRDEKFYKIFLSEDIAPTVGFSGTTCGSPAITNNYQLGITRTRDIISRKKLEELQTAYTNDYSALKTELGLENNFNFIVFDSSEVLFQGDENPPGGINVLAKDMVIEILNESADIVPAIMNIRTWEE